MKKYLAIFIIFFSLQCAAQQPEKSVNFKNPENVWTPKGFSQAVEIDLGNSKMVLISGQVALDKAGNLVGKDDFATQAKQIFQNIKLILENSGGSMNNLVKLNFYLRDVSQIQTLRNIRDQFINTQSPPASTLVEVSKLFREDILIEIEATAIVPKKD
jgi:enamine deaminase RidA (YjgF/YER057c/UK114 family)